MSVPTATLFPAYCWGQSIPTNGTGYDRYGNLLTINSSQCSSPALSLSLNTYNQITNSGYTYDAAGDMLTDGSGKTYTWNAEGMMSSAGSTTYTYDGDGKRVENSAGTYFWFTPDGTLLEESASTGTTLNEYFYFNGMRVAHRDSFSNVEYYFSDQIGTTQLSAKPTGAVCYDSDSTPFGYQMVYTPTCAQDFDFAGMQLDSETGNDHTWFRNYEPNLGRWMSPDRVAGSVTNPQSLNLYNYALNNPLSLVDPTGLAYCPPAILNTTVDGAPPASALAQCVSNEDYWDLVEIDSEMYSSWIYVYDIPVTSSAGDDSDDADYLDSPPGGGGAGGGAGPASNVPPCSAKKSAFINANSGAAGQIASQLNVPTANILGLAAEETGWGTSSIALNANNFFGIHAGAPGNIGTYTTSGGARVSMFPASTGFLSSGQSFGTNFGSLVKGVSNPTAFARALVPKFNTAKAATGGNPNFVRLVSGTIKGVSACGD
jgi:RHS repeat-associated protein